jgi:CheY-like chemotaxis protein
MPSTILIVEDDKEGRELMGELLALYGFQPVLASDGLAALELLKTTRPCVILLDLVMPRMDGWQFRQAQMSNPALKDIPVVVVSADGNVARNILEVRASAYLQKPVDPAELVRAIQVHCSGRQ